MVNNYIDTLVKKLDKLLKHPNIVINEVADSIGVKRETLWNYRSGKSVKSESSIENIEEAIRFCENRLSEASILNQTILMMRTHSDLDLLDVQKLLTEKRNKLLEGEDKSDESSSRQQNPPDLNSRKG